MRASFPHRLLWQDVTPRFVGASLEPQRAVTGVEAVVPTLGGHWEVTANFVIRDEAAQLQWQAFLAQMEGRVGTTLVPVVTRRRPRDRDGKSVSGCGLASLKDGQTWEHFGFVAAPAVGMVLAEAAPLRATTIRVLDNPAATTGIRPGQFFSLGERLYRVQHSWQSADGVTSLMVQPPLRIAAPAGALAVMDRPVCLMRMATETEGDFDQLLDRLPRVSCTFVEASPQPDEIPPSEAQA